MKERQYRLWWPKHLLSCKPSSDLVLFGWYIHSLNSLDIIVAVATSQHDFSILLQSDVQEILHLFNANMPITLQEVSKFGILGKFAINCSNRDMGRGWNHNNAPILNSTQCLGMEGTSSVEVVHYSDVDEKCNQESFMEASSAKSSKRWSCGCEKSDKFIDGNWIHLRSKSQGISCKYFSWIPECHHMHQNGHILNISDVHLVIYELPICGGHHFSLCLWGDSKHEGIPMKKPDWVSDLSRKLSPSTLEAVVLALNCSSAAMLFLMRRLNTMTPAVHMCSISRVMSILWHILAVSVALIATFVYIILQFLHKFVGVGSHTIFLLMLQTVFRQTWKNISIRSCQFLYWPVFLQGSGFKSRSNVEYAHRTALQKHFMWSSISMDVILGIIFGLLVLMKVEDICFQVSFVVRHITDDLLRSGCVWLMGVPAGFKLNTELAELLGMVSLNAIQIFSTLWCFAGSIFQHFIKGLAVSGITFGVTVPAAICIDMLKVATLHILTLHWLISFLYSQQIQALASLWRLFRGRKWNPLRQRLDSYEYTVEQHVVGSLLFTPVLLLLPTVSVFYIFFTMLNTTVSFLCIVLEISISILHATPYAEILLWMARRRRFPSGIWFEIISDGTGFTSIKHDVGKLTTNLDQMKNRRSIDRGPVTVLSLLRSNYATIGQIIAPSYQNVFRSVNSSLGLPWAYGILSGQRIPSTLETSLPPTLPWMHMGCREYWRLCYSSVLGCRGPE